MVAKIIDEALAAIEAEPRRACGLPGSLVSSSRASSRSSSEFAGVSLSVYVKRCANFRAVSATSRQPLSMVREWPRFGILAISVTAEFRRCRL
jgi:hypothetical protein